MMIQVKCLTIISFILAIKMTFDNLLNCQTSFNYNIAESFIFAFYQGKKTIKRLLKKNVYQK